MSISFHCEYCNKKIEAPDDAGGKWGKCPSCHKRLYVPGSEDGEELKLAPIDETEEQKKKRLMAETFHLTQDILQERDVPEESSEPPAEEPALDVTSTTEIGLAEQVATNRLLYRQGLEKLVDYYTTTGNNMKLTWAKKELTAFNSVTPQYQYIIQAEVAGPDLEATTSIPEAETLYNEALETYDKAMFLVLVDNKQLRMALDKFNQLIAGYPTSD